MEVYTEKIVEQGSIEKMLRERGVMGIIELLKNKKAYKGCNEKDIADDLFFTTHSYRSFNGGELTPLAWIQNELINEAYFATEYDNEDARKKTLQCTEAIEKYKAGDNSTLIEYIQSASLRLLKGAIEDYNNPPTSYYNRLGFPILARHFVETQYLLKQLGV